MEDILVPIGICVVLPLMIVWIVFRAANNKDNKRAEVLIKAIENKADIDIEKLSDSLGKTRKTPREILHSRLYKGCIFSLLGIAFGIMSAMFYFCDYFDMDEDAVTFFMILSGIFASIGIAQLIFYFVTRKSVEADESDPRNEKH